MRAAASVDDFLAAPVGTYIQRRSLIVWMPTPTLIGALHLGAFDARDHDDAVKLLELPFHPALAVPFDVVHDAQDANLFDRMPFEILAAILPRLTARFAASARRFAGVRPLGLAGATYSGIFHEVIAPCVEGRLFDDRAAAHAWLGIAPGSETAREIAELHAAVAAPSPWLAHVRGLLAEDLAGATLERVASAAGESTRTLQRRLAQHGTSFRAELSRARVAAAQASLADTETKVEAIARDLGFDSPSAFASWFERSVGQSPAAFRARIRGQS